MRQQLRCELVPRCEVVVLRRSGLTFVSHAMRILQRDSFDVVNLQSAASLLPADVASHVS